MTLVDIGTTVCLVMGAFFFLAGTVGILRFPDLLSRLHAVTKADNVGLGLVVLGLVLRAGSPIVAAKLILIWVFALVASATSSYLIASEATASRRRGPPE